jgi:hypothetical protein
VSFDPEPVAVQRANAAELPDPPRPLASDVGVALAGVEDGVTATVAVDDPAASSLWRYDGSDWQRVAEVDTGDDDADAGAVSGTVTGDGTVVALAEPADQDDRQSGGGDETTDDDQRDGSAGNGGGAESVGDGTFVVQSTASDDFGYLFVVDGSVEGTETGNVAADSGDTVVETGDGTVTVVGSTGSNAGDAFEVDGDVVEFYTPAPDDEYVLELDGEDVTDQIPEPSEHEDEEDDQ